MKYLNITLLVVFLLVLPSCHEDKGTVRITNNIKNVRLDNVSYGKALISHQLLPGETKEYTLYDYMSGVSFPMTEQVQFYMVKGDTKVYLHTKEPYKLSDGQTLEIVLTDDTEVVNPMNTEE